MVIASLANATERDGRRAENAEIFPYHHFVLLLDQLHFRPTNTNDNDGKLCKKRSMRSERLGNGQMRKYIV